jgi:hypothetical protein
MYWAYSCDSVIAGVICSNSSSTAALQPPCLPLHGLQLHCTRLGRHCNLRLVTRGISLRTFVLHGLRFSPLWAIMSQSIAYSWPGMRATLRMGGVRGS